MSDKLYVINTAKRIPCLHNITGPITTPTELDPLDVLSLVKSGYVIYEVNPYNKSERVRVTPFNYNSIRFKTTLQDMLQKKRLNREMQSIDKKNDDKSNKNDSSKENTSSKNEEKKDDTKKKESDKKVGTEEVKPQKLSHTDFEKHQ